MQPKPNFGKKTIGIVRDGKKCLEKDRSILLVKDRTS